MKCLQFFKNEKFLVVKQHQRNLKTRIKTTIETIEEAVANDAVDATVTWKDVMEQMPKDVGIPHDGRFAPRLV